MARAANDRKARSPRLLVPGLLVGVGLGGLIDGVVLHQILQWHHMLTDYGKYATFPRSTVAGLEDNTLADGLFHVATLILLGIGLFLLWRELSGTHLPVPTRALTGLLLAGWGLFNVVEGIVDHHILEVHHVRDDVTDPLPWDLGFLAFGAALVIVGFALYKSAENRPARTDHADVNSHAR